MPTEPSSTVKSITKTSGRAKSIFTTTKQPPILLGSTYIPETEISVTQTTYTDDKVPNLGRGLKSAGRRQRIAKAIRLVWDSLESHLDAAAGAELEKDCCNEMIGLPPFHRKCVKEYGFVINVLSELL